MSFDKLNIIIQVVPQCYSSVQDQIIIFIILLINKRLTLYIFLTIFVSVIKVSSIAIPVSSIR